MVCPAPFVKVHFVAQVCKHVFSPTKYGHLRNTMKHQSPALVAISLPGIDFSKTWSQKGFLWSSTQLVSRRWEISQTSFSRIGPEQVLVHNAHIISLIFSKFVLWNSPEPLGGWACDISKKNFRAKECWEEGFFAHCVKSAWAQGLA